MPPEFQLESRHRRSVAQCNAQDQIADRSVTPFTTPSTTPNVTIAGRLSAAPSQASWGKGWSADALGGVASEQLTEALPTLGIGHHLQRKTTHICRAKRSVAVARQSTPSRAPGDTNIAPTGAKPLRRLA